VQRILPLVAGVNHDVQNILQDGTGRNEEKMVPGV
jgi:hypothetical protein